MILLFFAAVVATPAAPSCKNDTSADLLVCGRPGERYRIDRSVLEASRALNATPPKPPLHADADPGTGCVGPSACRGGIVPLVGMALVAAKAAALAANGDDWRDAIRTHEDEYRLYKQAEERRAKERKPRIGLDFTNRNAPPR